MNIEKKNIQKLLNEVPKSAPDSIKSHHRDVDYLTEVLAYMAWTTMG